MSQNHKESAKKRFVIYTRCSTDEQAQGDFTTLDAQAHHCKNMLEAMGYELVRTVKDDGFSGKDLNRPGIQSVLKELGIRNQKRTFDGIIFFRLDRLTRNPRDLYGLIDLFKENETDFISVRENLDSSSALGRVVIGIIGLLSAFERELTGERVKASGLARVRQGKWIGGPLPFGYKLVDDGKPLPNGRQPHKIVVDPEIGPKLKPIWQMAADNKSLGIIAKELGRQGLKGPKGKPFWRQTVLKILSSRFYLGYVTWAKETHKGRHEAIIDKETWEKANKTIGKNLPGHRFAPQPKVYIYLLESLLRCGKCGSFMVNTSSRGQNGQKFPYYICSRKNQSLGCDAERLNASVFDNALIDYFRRSSYDQRLIIKAIERAVSEARVKLSTAEKEIEKLEGKLRESQDAAEKLVDLGLRGGIGNSSAYKARMEKIEEEIKEAETQLDYLRAKKKVAEMSANSGTFLHSRVVFAMARFNETSPEAQKTLFKSLIKEIVVHDERIELKMFIEQPLEGLPRPDKTAPTPLVETNGANAISHECKQWRPILDGSLTSQAQEIQLLVKLYKRRSKGLLLSLGYPLEKQKPNSRKKKPHFITG